MNYRSFAWRITILALMSSPLHGQGMKVSSFAINAINPISDQFPSGRGTDELVVYTPAWKSEHTGTNPYGTEAEVRKNVVTVIGGNNRRIPADGLILSGHGAAAHWLQNINVGDSIQIEGDSCHVFATKGSLRLKAAAVVNRLKGRRPEQRWLRELKKRAKGDNEFRDLADWKLQHKELDSLDAMAFASSLASPKEEWRGVWHRPRENSAEAIDAAVRRVASGNLNTIFLETFWGGKTIYPSELTEERPEFEGFDVLGAYVEAGKKYGVQIHSWVHTFFLGYQVPSKGIYDVPRKLEDHPEWRLVHRNGSTVSSLEPGYIWACPANPAVQEYVGSIYREIARKYAVAGIQHDYIRFPTSGTADESSCYCGYCRAAVKLELGFDLLTIADDDSIRHKQWQEWKESRISKFVREMSGSFPNKLLSAAVFPDIQMTRKDKMQNWVSWTEGPLIGLLSPMCYTSSTSEVENGLREMRRLSRAVPIAAGLAPFMGLHTHELLEQIEAARSCGSNGVIFFELTTLTDLSMAAFAHGPFRNRSKPPFSP